MKSVLLSSIRAVSTCVSRMVSESVCSVMVASLRNFMSSQIMPVGKMVLGFRAYSGICFCAGASAARVVIVIKSKHHGQVPHESPSDFR